MWQRETDVEGRVRGGHMAEYDVLGHSQGVKEVFFPDSERAEMLARTEWFDGFEWKHIEMLAKFMRTYEADTGGVLLREDERSSHMCLIVSGSVSVVKGDAARRVKPLATLGPGTTFGEMALIDEEPRSASVVAREKTLLLILSEQGFNQMAEDAPQLAVRLLTRIAQLMSKRLRRTSGALSEYLERIDKRVRTSEKEDKDNFVSGTMVTRQAIADGFRELGVGAGDVLLLHSSLSSFGRVEGGADTVIDGVLDALTKDGTLVVPTLTGSRDLSPANPPHIDLRTTPCWTGRIPEALRLRCEAVRSTHPTHSCAAIGARAEAIMRNHALSPTPCGVLSPYFQAALAGGKIVFAGCTLQVCTTCHTVEEIANVPYHLQSDVAYGSCIDQHGNHVETPVRLHSYEGPTRDFPVLEPVLLERDLMCIGKVGDSTVRLIDAMGLIETALEKVRFDPYYLTDRRIRS